MQRLILGWHPSNALREHTAMWALTQVRQCGNVLAQYWSRLSGSMS